VFEDGAVGGSGGVVDSVFGDFGDAGVGYYVDAVVCEFLFGEFGDFFVVGVEDVGIGLYDVHGDLSAENLGELLIKVRTSQLTEGGKGATYGVRSSCIMSYNSLANSTPVGPPPATTNDKSSWRCSSVVVGRQAFSKLSII